MKIIDRLKEDRIHLSMEVFPPKTETKFEAVEAAVKEITKLHPAFMSCTYGAGGGTSQYTVDISKEIMECGVPSMAHLTCISSTRETIAHQIESIKGAGIENILALRGDLPADGKLPEDGYKHATDLVYDIKRLYPEACIGGACYPEKHPDAGTKEEDIRFLKEKVEAGCDFLTTQMFFDNSVYYNFLYRLRVQGVNVPVLAGIMPITTKQQMRRSVELSGCIIPARFKAIVDMFGDSPEAMKQAGIVYASEQIIDLLANGIKNIHLYTMNKPDIAQAILDNLKGIWTPEE